MIVAVYIPYSKFIIIIHDPDLSQEIDPDTHSLI